MLLFNVQKSKNNKALIQLINSLRGLEPGLRSRIQESKSSELCRYADMLEYLLFLATTLRF